MPNKINLLRFLIVVLFLSSIAIATETTWRHSGFEVSGYDVNFNSTYNISEVRLIEWGWNTSTPPISGTNRAITYYNATANKIYTSKNGGGYYESAIDDSINLLLRVYNSTASATVASLTNTKIQFDTESYDVSNNYNTTTSNITIPTTGYYRYWYVLDVESFTADKQITGKIYVNGVDTYDQFKIAGALTLDELYASDVIHLNQSDTIELYVRLGGATGVIETGSFLGMEYIRSG